MKVLQKIIVIFLILMMGYHVFHTIFLYGLHLESPFFFSALKDIVWMLIIGGVFIVGRKSLGLFWEQWKGTLLLFLLLVIRSLFRSGIQGDSLKMMLVGLKYDLYPLMLLVSGILIGFVFAKNTSFLEEKNVKNIVLYVFSGITFLVLGGLLWQIGKIMIPDFFHWLGYGPVGDYILGAKPPLYYRTGPGGVMRLQGFFSGPNNYGYFLVSFFSFVVVIMTGFLGKGSTLGVLKGSRMKGLMRSDETKQGGIKLDKMKQGGEEVGNKKHTCFVCFNSSQFFVLSSWLFIVLYLISCTWTLSRGVLVGIGIQIILLVWFFKKPRRRQLVRVGIFGIFLMVSLSIRKWGSTILHIQARMDGIEAFLKNPWGYGLGSAGPAIHYDGVYLPENHYLQLLLDVGIPGFLLRCLVVVSIFLKTNIQNIQIHPEKDIFLILLFFGFIGLLGEGLFLHVLEDSMVNYLFLVIFGILIGKFSARGVVQ